MQKASVIPITLRRISNRNLLITAFSALILTLFFSLVSAPKASASFTSQQLPISINPNTIQVNSDSSLSFFHCFSFSQPHSKYVFAHTSNLVTFSNTIENSITSWDGNQVTPTYPWLVRCSDSGGGIDYALGDDGALYGTFNHREGTPPYWYNYFDKTGKYHNNAFQWQTGFYGCGKDNGAGAHSLTQGYDGDIYAHVDACSTNDQASFVGINSKTGVVKFSKPSSFTVYPPARGHLVQAYSDGVIFLDDTQVRYFDYSGQEMINKRYTITPNAGRSIGEIRATPNGTVYVRFKKDTPLNCSTPQYDEVYYRKLNGEDGYININLCTHAAVSRIIPDPSGGIIVTTLPNNNKSYIFRYNDSGSLLNTATLTPEQGHTLVTPSEVNPRIDTNGNIILLQHLRQTSGSPRYYHTAILRIDTNGNVNKLLSTTDSTNFEQQKNYYGTSARMGLAEDKIYATICKEDCSYTNTPYFFTINSPGISTDYPRNLIGSAIPGHNEDNDNDSLTKWQEIQQNTSDNTHDTDGDGIGDYQESRWYPQRHDLFCNNDQSTREYPNPSEKDVYVEVDWMTRPAENGNDSYTTKPNETQINEIKAAFSAKGIHAHFDTGQLGGGNEVPYNEVVKFGIVPNEADFFDYKKGGDGISANFNTERYQIYHYMLSGHRYNSTSAGNSGISLVSDDDFFVAFGSLKEDYGFVLPGQAEKAISGTIIHELGHNLCLTSGSHTSPECSFAGIDVHHGNDYPSAMNYDKQFELVDYSSGQNPSNDHDDWGAIRLQDFASSNGGDAEHSLLQTLQTQSARTRSPLNLQPKYKEFKDKLKKLEKRIESDEKHR